MIRSLLLSVVGAGSAGAVVANRLSKHNKVLLLEAGGDPYYTNSIPLLTPGFLGDTKVDWVYKTVPQVNSHLSNNNGGRSRWSRGKSLGGTSNLNFMMYVRGNPNDVRQ